MGQIRPTKNQDLIKAKKAYLRKVTFMKLVEVAKATAIVAIALKYTGLLEKLIQLSNQI